MAASENGRFEHQFRILLVVVALDLVVSLLLWGTLGGRQALGFFAVTTALLFLYTLFFCERMLEEGFRSESRIVARDMRYRQTLGLLPEGVVILGNNAEIEWMNVAAERHFGMDASVLGKPFQERCPTKDCAISSMRAALTSPCSVSFPAATKSLKSPWSRPTCSTPSSCRTT